MLGSKAALPLSELNTTMARNRKEKTKLPSPPLPEASEQLHISEDEQWRLVNESGILNRKIPNRSEDETEDNTPLADEIFNAVILIIPFSFLLLMMEMCVTPYPLLHIY
jgi:hypothetical protein